MKEKRKGGEREKRKGKREDTDFILLFIFMVIFMIRVDFAN